MSLIRVSNGRLYSFDESLGLIVHADELALLESSGADGVAITISGTVPGSGDTSAITLTEDGRLRVDASEPENPFAGEVWCFPDPFSKSSAW